MKKTIFFTLLCLLGFGAAQTAQAANEIYAVLDGTTTTFYYDSHKEMEMRGGARYWEMSWSSEKSQYLNNTKKVVFDLSMDDARPTSTRAWFSGFEKLEEIVDIRYLHTDEVTDMTEMFAHCRALKEIDVSGFNTSNVTSMNAMFMYCDKMESIDIYNFDISNVKDISRIFAFDGALKTIYCAQDWTQYSFDNSYYMFMYCTSLVGGDGTAYDDNHIGLDYAIPDGWNDMPGYFTARKEVYSEFVEATGTLTYYYDTKRNSREGITVRYNPESYNPENDKPLGKNSSSVKKAVIDESMKKAEMNDMSYLFSGLDQMTKIEGLSNLNTANVTNMSYMFADCEALTSIDLSSFNTANVTNMSCMFAGCEALTSIDLSSFNTANVTNMYGMFGCPALKELDLSRFNTANVTNMSTMFFACMALKELDLSRFNTANVTTMGGMFFGCSSLEKLDLSTFNTANVTDMKGMFSGCSSLEKLELSTFNTANVTNMSTMFTACMALKSLDISSFNTSNVTDMSDMFENCKALISLDLSSFNTANVTDMSYMFAGCEALTTIYCNKDWTEGKVTASDDMFTDCDALVGGNGTAYNAGKVNIEYARPDGLDDKPGYFTAVYTHAVTLIAENGTISVEEDVDLGAVPYGTTLHLTATPDENYEFAGWTNYDPETGLKVVSDITVTATFNLTATYRVTAVSADDALGEVTLTFDSEDIISKGEEANDFTVVPNAVGHLVATPKDKYTEFVRWNDEAEGFTLAERDITVTGDFDYIATFHKDSFSVSVSVEGIDPELVKVHGAGRYGRGDNATVSFTLNDDHYDFDMYLFDENNFRKTETLQFEEIDDHHDVRIVFKAKYYAVSATVIPAEAGVVKGQGDYEYGTDYTLTLEPAEGWELKEWRDGEALDEKSNVLTGYVYGEIHIECVLQKKEATALDAAEGTTGSAARKLLRNGTLLIERNGTTYTVHGAALK